MEIKQTLILETSESLSRVLPHLDGSPAVIITKDGKYYGIIDHHSIGQNVKEPHNTKCETVAAKPPVLFETAQIFDRVDAFLAGHFKALPVIDTNNCPIGITTRVELLKEMLKDNMIPQIPVTEVMSSPVYTVDENDTVGTVKRMIKEKKVRRLVVTRNRNLIGIVSTYDISALSNRPNLLASGRKDIKDNSIHVDEMKISSFLRPDVLIAEEETTLNKVVAKMVEKQVSSVIVVAEKKPMGVLSALDIFKILQEMAKDGIQINISGLDEDNKNHYSYITDRIGRVLEKFSKSFNIRNCNVHIREGKSTFAANLNFDSDYGHRSVKSENQHLKECIDELAHEASIILAKERERSKPKIKRRED